MFDHSDTRVLLIGNSIFPKDNRIDGIPNVLANLELLKQSLVDPEVIGIPEANITILYNEDKQNIEEHLWTIAEETRHRKYTLLIYYTGHGILSDRDYRLYLSTNNTNLDRLVVTGIDTEKFKNIISGTNAGRKIVILDCCHSGAIIGAMGDLDSTIQAGLNGFTGTYVMTSAAKDEPSLFPVKDSGKPTYFTGKLIEILNEGLDTETEYCSLRDIFNKIQLDLVQLSLPKPQQSNFDNADRLYFSKNRKFLARKSPVDLAWSEIIKKRSKWDYMDFRKQFPNSIYDQEAKQKIYDLDEEECWSLAKRKDTLSAYYDYIDKYPEGKHKNEAEEKIDFIREKEGKGKKNEEDIAGSKINLQEQEEAKARHYTDIWTNANDLFSEKKFSEALLLYDEALTIMPGRIEVNERIKICKERINEKTKKDQFDELLEDAKKCMTDNDLDKANGLVEQSLILFPGNEIALLILDEIREKAQKWEQGIDLKSDLPDVYKFIFLNFIISAVLSSLYIYAFRAESLNAFWIISNIISLSMLPSFLIFWLLFSRLSKSHSIRRCKLYVIPVFLLTPFIYSFLRYMFSNTNYAEGIDIGYFIFYLNPIAGKTFFLIPIISTLLLPVRRINSNYDTFKFSFLPFCCSLLILILISILKEGGNVFLVFALNIGSLLFGLVTSFAIFSILLKYLLNRKSIVKSKILASSALFLYPLIIILIGLFLNDNFLRYFGQSPLLRFIEFITLSSVPIIFVFLFKIKNEHLHK